MSQRAYTVAEVDRIRAVVKNREYALMPDNQCFYQDELDARIENMVRTYIAAGISVEDVEKAAGEAIAERYKLLTSIRP